MKINNFLNNLQKHGEEFSEGGEFLLKSKIMIKKKRSESML